MPSKVIVNFTACMHLENTKVEVHDFWMSQMKLRFWRLGCCIYVYNYGRCVFCVWVCVNVFPLRCRSCYWTNTKLLGKGCCSKTSMNGNISMACYESQNPVTKESVVVGQSNRRPVVVSSNVYSPNGGNVTGDSFSVWFSGKRYVWWSPLPQRRETHSLTFF